MSDSTYSGAPDECGWHFRQGEIIKFVDGECPRIGEHPHFDGVAFVGTAKPKSDWDTITAATKAITMPPLESRIILGGRTGEAKVMHHCAEWYENTPHESHNIGRNRYCPGYHN